MPYESVSRRRIPSLLRSMNDFLRIASCRLCANTAHHAIRKRIKAKSALHNWVFWRQCDVRHGEQMSVDWETCIDERNEDRHHVTDVDRLGMIPLRNVQCRSRDDFLPTQTHVSGEDDN